MAAKLDTILEVASSDTKTEQRAEINDYVSPDSVKINYIFIWLDFNTYRKH